MKFAPEQLFVYQVVPQLLESLELMYFDSSTVEEVSPSPQPQPQSQQERSPSRGTAEPVVDHDTTLQVKDKEYYKSDLYRLNLKRQSRGLPPLSDQEFDQLADELNANESISASEDESDDDADIYDNKKDQLDTIFEKSVQKLEQLKVNQDEEEGIVSHLATRSPYILFKSPLLEDNECIGVFKALFNTKEIEDPINALQSWQANTGMKSAIFMIGGGHFAGAIVSHKPKSIKGQVAKTPQDLLLNSVDFIEHKSFHRYTTRRKQGGSQGAMDSAKGKANSAGSNLRRANEFALMTEVRELLNSWKRHLDECQSVFIRASGMQSRNTLLGYEGAPLRNDDDRVRSFPFSTKRATSSELKRAWLELTSLAVTSKPKTDDKKLRQRLVQLQLEQSQQLKVKQEAEITPEVKYTREIIAYLKKSRGPVLISYMKKHALPDDFKLQPQAEYYHTPTVLHYAAAHGVKNLIGVLLKTMKCDPSVLNKAGKTPYDLSANQSVKLAFRVARSELGEDAYDWDAAHVDSPITREEVEAADTERKREEEDEKKRLQREELEKKPVVPIPQPGTQKKLGGVSMAQVNINSLSDDQRMRLMREQRARAVEARMKLQQN